MNYLKIILYKYINNLFVMMIAKNYINHIIIYVKILLNIHNQLFNKLFRYLRPQKKELIIFINMIN